MLSNLSYLILPYFVGLYKFIQSYNLKIFEYYDDFEDPREVEFFNELDDNLKFKYPENDANNEHINILSLEDLYGSEDLIPKSLKG